EKCCSNLSIRELNKAPNVCLLARCLLDKDTGTVCSSYQSRWFYDRNTRECRHFWYGGCNGNSNRFLNKNECLETCARCLRAVNRL
uniref:BPTI/Kunitz inhibitor domain-containing protein n=1 Tax=Pygocentrus nattereri TaxID=42514 RepID=A0A3B4BZ59_PYGNA